MTQLLNVFRIVADEFSGVEDETVNLWLDLTAPLVSRKRFGKLYEQALALLTAHRMKMAAVGSDKSTGNGVDDFGDASIAFKVGSYSSGGESVSFNTSGLTSRLSADAEYSQTTYGVQYLTLRTRCMVSIICSGESG